MPRPKKQEVSNKDLLKVLQEINQVLAERLPKPQEETVSADITATQPVEESDPVPFEFRQVVDEILNKHFGIRMKNGLRISEGVDGFQLTIVVPDKYSTANEYQKQSIGGMDIRFKAVPYALREIGVKDYCDLIWKTFNEDIQGQITEDRLKDAI